MLVVAKGHAPEFVSKVDPLTGPITATLKPVDHSKLDPKNQIRGRVLDPDGQPLSGAVVHFEGYTSGTGGRGGSVPGFDPLSVTDDTGAFLLTGNLPFDEMEVKVEARGFANKRFEGLASGGKNHDLRVSLGGSVSGRVLLNGQPLKSAGMGMVSVSRLSGEFTGDFEFGTQADGTFQFVNLPPNTDYYLYGLVASLKEFGAIPSRRIRVNGDGTTTEAGDVLVERGMTLAGHVTLSDGGRLPPNTRVTVSWDEAWDVQFTALDEVGHFSFRNLPPGKLSISTRVAGYRPSARNASLDAFYPYQLAGRLTADKSDLTILLEPGEGLKADFSAFPSNREDHPQNWPLLGVEVSGDSASARTFTGRVLDAETQQPIARFRLIPGRESTYPGPPSRAPATPRPPNLEQVRALAGTNGVFAITVQQRKSRPLLMVEAEGYLPVISPPFEAGQATFDFQLKSGRGAQGSVVFADGRPAGGLAVVLLPPREQVSLMENGHFSEARRGAKAVTDAKGQFAFPPMLEAGLVAVMHESGFARRTTAALGDAPQLALEPWGKIRGTLTSDGKPAAGEMMTVTFNRAGKFDANEPIIHLQQRSTTDAQGRFEFDRVPPGELQLVILVPTQGSPGGRSWSHSPQRSVTLKPGETLSVELIKQGGSQSVITRPARK